MVDLWAWLGVRPKRPGKDPGPGGKDPEPGGPLSAREHRAAVHEIGHALGHWFDPFTVALLGIQILDDGGSCEVRRVVDTGRSARWYFLVGVLGGFAAEMVEFGSARSGSARADLAIAKKTADEIVGTNGHREPPPWGLTPRAPFHMRRVYREVDPRAVQVLNVSYDRARLLWRQEQVRAIRLVHLLSSKKKLDGEDLEAVFGVRPDGARLHQVLKAARN